MTHGDNLGQSLFRPAIERMTGYTPGEQPRAGQRVIKLNTNENPYPPSPQVRRAILEAAKGARLRLYPPPRADSLVERASQVYGIGADMILAGNGSDELLAMLFRAALGRRDTVAYPVPTYSLYDTLAAIQEARVVAIPFEKDFVLPLQRLARARAKLTIICNPNSPSGTCTPVSKLAALARQLDGRLLVIDEAYVDFADENALELIRRWRNVVVLRSFSKSFSLAGARIGLCFGHRAVIETLLKVKDSYNLNRMALAAGTQALADIAWMRANVERIRQTRRATEEKLRLMGFQVFPSSANFVLARLPGRDLQPIAEQLARGGILVRYFARPDLRDALRISIGLPKEMSALFKALRSLLTSLPRESTAANSDRRSEGKPLSPA